MLNLNSKPFFFSFAGTDGCGKTTTLNMLRSMGGHSDEPVLYLDKQSVAEDDGYVSSHLTALCDLVWGHPSDSPVHLLGEMHWMHLQAAWFHTVSHSRVRPAMSAGKSVFVDGWYHKLLARVAMAPTLDRDRVAGFLDGVMEPDFVILLDVDTQLTMERKETFSQIEGGNLQGTLRASRQSFQHHQRALREELLSMADQRGWHVLPVTGQSRDQVCAHVLDALADWKRGRSALLQPTS
jgi:dTMP kinase